MKSAYLAGGTAAVACLAWASVLLAHDLFLKLDTYFVAPGSTVRIPVYNGTFSTSESGVEPQRLLDLSLVSPQGRARLSPSAWRTEERRAWLAVQVGDPGTYVVGASVRPNRIELTGPQFNEYLKEDGITNVLSERTRNHQLDQPARERYGKHVKAVFQAGDQRTDGFTTVLGYPAEIVPLANPYTLKPGAALRVRCLVDGKPVAHQIVLWGGEGVAGPIAQRK